jgi:hypothetical protein
VMPRPLMSASGRRHHSLIREGCRRRVPAAKVLQYTDKCSDKRRGTCVGMPTRHVWVCGHAYAVRALHAPLYTRLVHPPCTPALCTAGGASQLRPHASRCLCTGRCQVCQALPGVPGALEVCARRSCARRSCARRSCARRSSRSAAHAQGAGQPRMHKLHMRPGGGQRPRNGSQGPAGTR